MCGRYVFYPDERIYDRYHTQNRLQRLEKHYNVAPGQSMPVVIKHSPNILEVMRWGLIPFWAKDPRIGYKLINARAESVSTKPAFKYALKRKRCLVPSNGFYEWHKTEENKIPYYIHLKNKEYFSFAGLYDTWKDAEGKEIKSYTIITTEPNSLMAPIHNRMPVILKKDDEDTWLNKETDINSLVNLLKPYPPEEMVAYHVSDAVNSPRINSQSLIEPLPTP